jgi:hypothetical protein
MLAMGIAKRALVEARMMAYIPCIYAIGKL